MDATTAPADCKGSPWCALKFHFGLPRDCPSHPPFSSVDDGNVIIQTQEPIVAFKVHRSVLARHSEVFRSMFEIPQPPVSADVTEECQIVPSYDHFWEMSNL